MDNRPLKFEEFEALQNQVLYVSATPADYELKQTEGVYVEQIIRPTGLLDPEIEIRPSLNQIDDLIEEIQIRVEKTSGPGDHFDQENGGRIDQIFCSGQHPLSIYPQ